MPFGNGGNYELWVMNSDGTGKQRLLDESWYPNEAIFTPDGRILFRSARVSPHSSKLEDGNIWMMNQDGSNKILIVPEYHNNAIFSRWPAINSNGTIIVFEHGLDDEHYGLYYVQDSTGLWKDSDGDGVWDGIDGAPFDPNEGYIKDGSTENFIYWLKNNLFVVCSMIVAVVLIPVLAIIFLLLRRRRK
jgi:Tol biopolymer transport system component